MTFAVETAYGTDYAHFDGVLTLTLTPLNPTSTAASAVKGVRESIEQEEISGNEYAVAGRTTVFHVWNSTLAGITPKNGDRITDPDGVNWYIKTTGRNGREPRWRFGCRRGVS